MKALLVAFLSALGGVAFAADGPQSDSSVQECLKPFSGDGFVGTPLGWTGTCVNGRRDGHGVYTQRVEMVSSTGSKIVTETAHEYGFVKGAGVGLSCLISSVSTLDGKPMPPSDYGQGWCMLVGAKVVPKQAITFRKIEDGRW